MPIAQRSVSKKAARARDAARTRIQLARVSSALLGPAAGVYVWTIPSPIGVLVVSQLLNVAVDALNNDSCCYGVS